MTGTKPLGYWLRHLHDLLEEHFALVVSDLGLTRRDWQVLNTLAQGAQPHTALAPFRDSGFARVLAGLRERGWIEGDDDSVRLTPGGETAHADLATRVEQARAVVLGDLTPDEYGETVQRLAVMAANVEAALAA